ncbi:MATE family efflux transporter [Pseudobutyrivibrio xylanivorans]|uniref:Probable multidrug resistance protein NorM n=1 Tax=Pseudobutyrivibrio xylanivorans TaxID=185007 RepID=A0A1G5S3M0_PSEXY|nr:MATE family efflux transporter [Pseudobutyrivibrio xylanivorans]SCZ80758.1 putative efflux protein, MATE family [Pseudobutyrivibrio xylanivorans]
MNSSKIDMTHGPLLGKLIIFTIPIILSGVLQLLFNAADVIVVGRFAGEASLAAVGSTNSLINLMTNLFIGMSVGANVCAAQFFGAGQLKDVRKTVHTSTAFSLICGVILIFIGAFGARPMLELMGSPADVISLAALYVRIYFIAMPAIMLYNFLAAILRSAGDTKHPLIFLTVAGVINVLFNLVLVIVFKLGVAGVAIATVTSNYISCGMLVAFFMKQDDALKLEISKISIDGRILKKIIRIGLPAGIQGTVFSLSNVVIQSAINSFGTAVIAGSSAAGSIEGFVYISMNSVSQTCVTFVGQNYGAGDEKRVKRVIFECLGIVTVVGLVMGNLAHGFAGTLLGIYTDSPEAIAAGTLRLFWVCCPYFLCGIMDSLTGGLRGLGNSTLPMIVSLLGACATRLIWIATYFQIHHTQNVLFFSYPGSWFLTLTVHSICLTIIYKKWVQKKSSEIRI